MMYMNTWNIFLVYKLCFLWINYLSFDIPLRHYSSPPLSKTFLFRSPHLVPNVPSSTRSPTQNGMCTCFIVHAASMILDAQLVWHERMSIRSVCKSCTLGRIIIEVIVTPVLCRTAILCMYEANGASQARHPRRASHASQIQKGLLSTLPEAARCFRSTICCCLLAKKNKLTPLRKFCSS